MLEENSIGKLSVDEDTWNTTAYNDTLIQAECQEQQRRFQLEPEKRLMLAMLQDAVACYRRNSGTRMGKRRQLFLEVENWINDRKNDRLFSFSNVCDTLGIDPEYLARGLLREADPSVKLPEISQLRLEASSQRRSHRKRREQPKLQL